MAVRKSRIVYADPWTLKHEVPFREASDDLTESIRQDGLREPLVVVDGAVVDGCRRLDAVRQLIWEQARCWDVRRRRWSRADEVYRTVRCCQIRR